MVRIGCCVAVRAAGTYVPRSLTMWDRRFGSRGSSGGVSDVAAQSRICNAFPKAKCRSKSRRTFAFLVSRHHTHIYITNQRTLGTRATIPLRSLPFPDFWLARPTIRKGLGVQRLALGRVCVCWLRRRRHPHRLIARMAQHGMSYEPILPVVQ
jgi:hypothetical protein